MHAAHALESRSLSHQLMSKKKKKKRIEKKREKRIKEEREATGERLRAEEGSERVAGSTQRNESFSLVYFPPSQVQAALEARGRERGGERERESSEAWTPGKAGFSPSLSLLLRKDKPRCDWLREKAKWRVERKEEKGTRRLSQALVAFANAMQLLQLQLYSPLFSSSSSLQQALETREERRENKRERREEGYRYYN